MPDPVLTTYLFAAPFVTLVDPLYLLVAWDYLTYSGTVSVPQTGRRCGVALGTCPLFLV